MFVTCDFFCAATLKCWTHEQITCVYVLEMHWNNFNDFLSIKFFKDLCSIYNELTISEARGKVRKKKVQNYIVLTILQCMLLDAGHC